MRIDLYSAEMVPDARVIEEDGCYGVRFYLKAHPDVRERPNGHNYSIVTFWGIDTITDLLEIALEALTAYKIKGRIDV